MRKYGLRGEDFVIKDDLEVAFPEDRKHIGVRTSGSSEGKTMHKLPRTVKKRQLAIK